MVDMGTHYIGEPGQDESADSKSSVPTVDKGDTKKRGGKRKKSSEAKANETDAGEVLTTEIRSPKDLLTRFGGQGTGLAGGFVLANYVGSFFEETFSSQGNSIFKFAANTGGKIITYYILKTAKKHTDPETVYQNIFDGAHMGIAGSIVFDAARRLSGSCNIKILDSDNIQNHDWKPLTQLQIQEINNKINSA